MQEGMAGSHRSQKDQFLFVLHPAIGVFHHRLEGQPHRLERVVAKELIGKVVQLGRKALCTHLGSLPSKAYVQ